MKTTDLKKAKSLARKPPADPADAPHPKRRKTVTQKAEEDAPSLTTPCVQEARRDATAVATKLLLETSVAVKFDTGFGNRLFVRGEGNGLSWDKGEPMQCVGDVTWIWSTRQAAGKVVFKILLNDECWSAGDNYTIEPGQHIELVPQF